MERNPMQALIDLSQANPAVREALKSAATPEDFIRVAASYGLDLTAEDLTASPGQLSDAELESVSGGYTFPKTDWIYCDNPWTNVYCTLKC